MSNAFSVLTNLKGCRMHSHKFERMSNAFSQICLFKMDNYTLVLSSLPINSHKPFLTFFTFSSFSHFFQNLSLSLWRLLSLFPFPSPFFHQALFLMILKMERITMRDTTRLPLYSSFNDFKIVLSIAFRGKMVLNRPSHNNCSSFKFPYAIAQ